VPRSDRGAVRQGCRYSTISPACADAVRLNCRRGGVTAWGSAGGWAAADGNQLPTFTAKCRLRRSRCGKPAAQ
jgi:hypothetical protein